MSGDRWTCLLVLIFTAPVDSIFVHTTRVYFTLVLGVAYLIPRVSSLMHLFFFFSPLFIHCRTDCTLDMTDGFYFNVPKIVIYGKSLRIVIFILGLFS